MENSNYFVFTIHYIDSDTELKDCASFKSKAQAKKYMNTMMERIFSWDPQLVEPKILNSNIYDNGILKYAFNIISRDALEENNEVPIKNELAAVIKYFLSKYKQRNV